MLIVNIDENLPDLSGIPIFDLAGFFFLLDMVTVTLVVPLILYKNYFPDFFGQAIPIYGE